MNKINPISPNFNYLYLDIHKIKYFHQLIDSINIEIELRIKIVNKYKLLNDDDYLYLNNFLSNYKSLLYNNNLYKKFLIILSLENINKYISIEEYNFLNNYISYIKSNFKYIIDPDGLYINNFMNDQYFNNNDF